MQKWKDMFGLICPLPPQLLKEMRISKRDYFIAAYSQTVTPISRTQNFNFNNEKLLPFPDNQCLPHLHPASSSLFQRLLFPDSKYLKDVQFAAFKELLFQGMVSSGGRKSGELLKQAAQEGGGDVQEECRCGSLGHSLVSTVMLG